MASYAKIVCPSGGVSAAAVKACAPIASQFATYLSGKRAGSLSLWCRRSQRRQCGSKQHKAMNRTLVMIPPSRTLLRICRRPELVSMRYSPYIGIVGVVSASKVELLLSTVTDLAELDDPLPFTPQVLQRLNAVVLSDWCAYTELDRVRQHSLLNVWWSSGSAETSRSANRRGCSVSDGHDGTSTRATGSCSSSWGHIFCAAT